MSKSLKIVIIAGAVWVAASASYYFVYYLPKQGNEARIFAANQKCYEIGRALYDIDSQNQIKSEEKGVYISINSPRYGYSKKLNTCVYSSGFYRSFHDEGEHFVASDFVKDSYSGQNIISRTDAGGKNEDTKRTGLSNEEFNKQEEELFKQ